MVGILEQYVEDLWDQRYWELALTAKEPMESYKEMKDTAKSLRESPALEELPSEQQAWLRKV